MFATPISCVDALSLRCAHSLRCSLCLHSKANVPCLHGASQDLEFAQASKFFLSYYVAEKNIWYSMPENNEEKKQRDVSVSVTTVEFPSELLPRTRVLIPDRTWLTAHRLL